MKKTAMIETPSKKRFNAHGSFTQVV